MRIFEGSGWGSKVNFADENNVLLGYDMDANCCEHFGWFISDKPEKKVVDGFKPTVEELVDYRFDIVFFNSVDACYEDGGIRIFKISNGSKDLYIHLYNIHNGYYSHGFKFKFGEEVIISDSI